MGTLTKTFQHTLGKEEAVRRLRERIASEKISKASIVTVTREVWNTPYSLDFSMSAFNYRIDGSLKIEDTIVTLDLNLPLGAMIFKGMIEKQIGQQMEIMLN